MRTADFDFDLPPDLIAQHPAERRDRSRLLVINRQTGQICHHKFADLLSFLRQGDVLVFNDSRVIPARLRGLNERSQGRFELLLLEEVGRNDWWAMVRPGKRARVGTDIRLLDHDQKTTPVIARVIEVNAEGHRRLQFFGVPDVSKGLASLGEVPLPPYIRRSGKGPEACDLDRYQTVYATAPGSVAAPTAGLHFTPALLAELRARGAECCFVTLHVGLGTFAPVKAETLAAHAMHEERYAVSAAAAASINAARRSGRRVLAVGTTSLRVLESVAEQADGAMVAGLGRTRIFIHPPFRFRMGDALLTNFHLPRSTLVMLVSAFAAPGETHGRDLVRAAYREAIRERYRFFSYGDAMLLV